MAHRNPGTSLPAARDKTFKWALRTGLVCGLSFFGALAVIHGHRILGQEHRREVVFKDLLHQQWLTQKHEQTEILNSGEVSRIGKTF